MFRCSGGAILLVVAFVLSIMVTISTPYVRSWDSVRTYFEGRISASSDAVNEIRLGVWGYCLRAESNGDWTCTSTGLAYTFGLEGANGTQEWIGKSWTRGLVMTAVATGFIFVTMIVAFTEHFVVAALLAFFSSFVTLIFVAINLALYLYVRAKMRHLGTVENTDFGSGFWMSIAVLIICSAAGSALLVERRRVRAAQEYGASYRYGPRPGLLGRIFPGKR